MKKLTPIITLLLLHFLLSACSKDKSSPATELFDKANSISYTTIDNKPLDIADPMAIFGAAITGHEYINGKGTIYFDRAVTEIGENAFKENSRLITVTLPETIRKIGEFAFYHSSLQSINFPANLTAIEQYAFATSKIKEVCIESNHMEFGLDAFLGAPDLIKVDLSKVTSVEWSYGTFHMCTALSEVKLGNIKTLGNPIYITEITGIHGGPFYRCSSLKHIDLPQSLEMISPGAFTLSGLTEISFPDNLKEICIGAFSTCIDLNCDIIIPQSVERIGLNAFGCCEKLSGHTLDLGNVKQIGPYAFTSSDGSGVFTGIQFGKIIMPDTPPTFDAAEPHPFGNVESDMPKTYYVHSESSAALYRNSPWNTGNTNFIVLN